MAKKFTMYILYVKDSGQDPTDIDQQNFSVHCGSPIAADSSSWRDSFLGSWRSSSPGRGQSPARNGGYIYR